ncbi:MULTISPECIES: hypothetical protein [Bacillales]|uniref:hypothetical protein n=1 Tax=Bacillales TaxID=1385 RepID=UPI0003748047|nr:MULTISPECIES: hypothetical protein [Bacillales]KMZ41720.1 hypothetical protein AC624_11810 [Bacillus sp. FJAT-27238]
MLRGKFKNILLCAVAVSGLTIGTQGAFASDSTLKPIQKQSQEKMQANAQGQVLHSFDISRVDRWQSSGPFTLNSTKSVKLKVLTANITWSPVTPYSEVSIVRQGDGKRVTMSIYARDYKEEDFVLESGTYYLEFLNHTSMPVYMRGSIIEN